MTGQARRPSRALPPARPRGPSPSQLARPFTRLVARPLARPFPRPVRAALPPARPRGPSPGPSHGPSRVPSPARRAPSLSPSAQPVARFRFLSRAIRGKNFGASSVVHWPRIILETATVFDSQVNGIRTNSIRIERAALQPFNRNEFRTRNLLVKSRLLHSATPPTSIG